MAALGSSGAESVASALCDLARTAVARGVPLAECFAVNVRLLSHQWPRRRARGIRVHLIEVQAARGGGSSDDKYSRLRLRSVPETGESSDFLNARRTLCGPAVV